MKTTTKISISIPPELLKKADWLARKEDRTRSAVFREALRLYIREREAKENSAIDSSRKRLGPG